MQYIIQRYVRENRIEDKGRNAPNKIFSDNDERWILRKIKQNPTLSAPLIAKDAEIFWGKSVVQRLFEEYSAKMILMDEFQERSRLSAKKIDYAD